MAEQETPPVDDPEGQEPEGDEAETPPAGDAATEASRKANREAKNLRDRLKAAEAKLAERDDADKTETQRLADRVAAAEQSAAEAAGRADRLEVAAAKGLTPAQAARLQGATPEELEADADALLELFRPAEPPTGAPRRRPHELQGGNDPETEGVGTQSLADIGESMFSH